MITSTTVWASGDAYEHYVGRWSRQVAPQFLEWLAVAPHQHWLDVGCGTGALIESILRTANPTEVEGIDSSAAHVSWAMNHLHNDHVVVKVADAQSLPFADATFDTVVSGLVLNFVPDPTRAIAEMRRVTRAGGIVAVYVWDYLDRMEMMRYFWTAAKAVDAEAQSLDEGVRFAAISHPDILNRLFTEAGLCDVETTTIDVPTVFRDFDDYWLPFLGGYGTAPHYLVSRPPEVQTAIREHLRNALPVAPDGSISLIARALAVRGHTAA